MAAKVVMTEYGMQLGEKADPSSDTVVLLGGLAMPKMDGADVIKELIKINPDVKIILVTANADNEIIQECLKNGATTFILKPFS